MLKFPELSRKPALRTGQKTIDPTLRDTMENGIETTRAKFSRTRREFSITIDLLTPADKLMLDSFVQRKVVFGAGMFLFPDLQRDPQNPVWLTVRFSVLPSYTDAGNVDGEFRQNCTFTLREV